MVEVVEKVGDLVRFYEKLDVLLLERRESEVAVTWQCFGHNISWGDVFCPNILHVGSIFSFSFIY
jgi:hypothetical protein